MTILDLKRLIDDFIIEHPELENSEIVFRENSHKAAKTLKNLNLDDRLQSYGVLDELTKLPKMKMAISLSLS